MKKAILAIGLLASISGFAQVYQSGNGMDVCESIRRATSFPERVNQCLQIVSRNSFDAQVVNLLSKLASSSTVEVLNSLNVTANNSYDPAAIQVCENIRTATSFPERVTECLRTTANNGYSADVAALASRLTRSSTLEANNIMKTAMNSYFMPEAVSACEAIRVATSFPERVTLCVNTIKNKMFLNGSENFCARMANTSTNEVISCLANSALDYVPAPAPRDIIISAQELRDLKRDLLKARAQIERGMTSQALQVLGDAIRTVDTLDSRR